MPKRPNIAAVVGKAFDDAKPSGGTVHPLRHILKDENAARVLLLPVNQLEANPDQPRKHFDPAALDDLTASVREKGILQPIIVRKKGTGDTCVIIAGERRWRAAKAAGLKDIPALVRGTDDAREVALIENLQRENLNPVEEAEALFALKTERGYTDAQLAKIVGKSRVSITESLSLTQLPEAIRGECRRADIWSKRQLLQVLRAGNGPTIEATWEALKEGGTPPSSDALRSQNRKAKGAVKRPSPFVYQYVPDDKSFRLTLTFRKARVSRDELRATLKVALKSLRE